MVKAGTLLAMSGNSEGGRDDRRRDDKMLPERVRQTASVERTVTNIASPLEKAPNFFSYFFPYCSVIVTFDCLILFSELIQLLRQCFLMMVCEN